MEIDIAHCPACLVKGKKVVLTDQILQPPSLKLCAACLQQFVVVRHNGWIRIGKVNWIAREPIR